MRLRAGFLIGILFVVQMTATPDTAAAQTTVYRNCEASIAAIIAKRETQNKLALDARSQKYKRYDASYQRNVKTGLDAQFQKWLAESKAIFDEFKDMQKMPHTKAKLARHGALDKKLTGAREAHLKAQQEILLKWRKVRSDQMKAAQDTFEKAIARNNSAAQDSIDTFRRNKCD